MSLTLWYDVLIASAETLYMVIFSTLMSFLLGLPLGILLFTTEKIMPNKMLQKIISGYINICRSIPFIILLVALIPITRFIVGSSIGINAAVVPLVLAATPFFARLANNVFHNLPEGLIETGSSMGATKMQMIRHILLPEAIPSLIQAVTVTAIALVNYSAMAGTVGGGGLGDLAIRYGYQRFNLSVMLVTIIVLIAIVQLIQMLGDKLVARYTH